MALLLKGGPVAEAMSKRLLDQCAALKNAGVTPVFAMVRVGEKANDIAYERGAAKRAGLLGVEVRHVVLPESITEDQLVHTLENINEDDSVHGCLLFRPLPAHLDTARVARTLRADKDVDAMTSSAMGVLLSPNAMGYVPCTAQASLEILKFYQIPLQGKRVTVIGKSMTVGLPTALLMMNQEATVSVCHILSRPQDTRALCKDADIIIDGYVHFGKKEIDAMDHCKVISFQSTGYNEADLDYAREKGIAVCSILDYCTQETAESAMALMLNLQRGIRQYDRSVQQDHVWDYQVVPHLKRIAGQVMGIAGLGRIGQSVARKALAFDMEVIAYDPFLPPAIAENLGVKLVDFDTLLAESDVLSLHMNLTDENYHMFNKEAFMKCKKHPIIVNEGRGPLICDEDLVWALDNGYIRGAALDMVESEDPDLDTCPLVGRDDVLLTPHSGYYSDTSNYLVAKLSMDNALYYVNGEYDKVKAIRNGVNA